MKALLIYSFKINNGSNWIDDLKTGKHANSPTSKPLRSQTSMEKAKMIRRNIVCFTFDEFHDLSQKLLQLTGNVVISK